MTAKTAKMTAKTNAKTAKMTAIVNLEIVICCLTLI